MSTEQDRDELLRRDRAIYGMSFMLNGERVDPERVRPSPSADAAPPDRCGESYIRPGGAVGVCNLPVDHDGTHAMLGPW